MHKNVFISQTAQVLELETKNMFELLLNEGYYYYLLVDRQNIVNGTFSNLSSTDTTSLKKPLLVSKNISVIMLKKFSL